MAFLKLPALGWSDRSGPQQMEAVNAERGQCTTGVFIRVERVAGGIAVVHGTLRRLREVEVRVIELHEVKSGPLQFAA
jgi:hypothetical protein